MYLYTHQEALPVKLPPEGLGHRAADAGLPHSRGPHKAEDGPLEAVGELAHSEVLHHPLLHLLQPIVVSIQNLAAREAVHNGPGVQVGLVYRLKTVQD